MTVLREWASGFCAAGIACALLAALCPKGTVRRAFGVLTALLMLCALLSPVHLLIQSFTKGTVTELVEQEVPTDVSETVMEQAVTVIERVVYADALGQLGDTDVTLRRVRVIRDMREETRIYIQSVQLVFDKDDHPVDSLLVQRLSMAWGVPTEVLYEDG